MANPLGTILKSINMKGELLEREFVEAEYKPFVVNRSLSYFMDCVLFVNELNALPKMPVYDQYLFYYYSIPKSNRFAPWHKPSKDKYLQAVMEFYNYSAKKAETALKILSEAQCEAIAKRVSKGGKGNGKT